MYRLVACIPILGSYFIKNAKRMCVCDYVKNQIRTCKNVFFQFEKGISRLLSWIAPKHTTVTKGLKPKVRKFWWLSPTLKLKGKNF